MVRQTTIPLSLPASQVAERIERALWLTPGVWVAYVNPVAAAVYVEFETDQCTPEVLAQAVARSISTRASDSRSIEG